MALPRLQRPPSIAQNSPWPKNDYVVAFVRTKSAFGSFVAQAASVVNIPAELIYGKIAVESQGYMNSNARNNNSEENDSYVGLMQVGKNTIEDCLNWLTGQRYSDGLRWTAPAPMVAAVTPIIKKYLPSFNPKDKNAAKNLSSAAFAAAKKHAEFNVLMGAIEYKFLLDNPKFTDGDLIRLDKVVAAYNWGQNRSLFDAKSKSLVSDTAKLIAAIPSNNQETKNHVLKLMGTNGAYDLLFNKKVSY